MVVAALREETWDRAAFIATYAINANPYRKTPLIVRNPLAEEPPRDYALVRLEDVDVLK